MHIDFSFAPWGMVFAAMMYVVGNGLWTNHLVRHKLWLGWLLWAASALLVIVVGALVELRLSGSGNGIWQTLTAVNIENHWIVATLYALMCVPGAASVLFRQSLAWTRLSTILTAIIIFVPLGAQLHDPNDSRLFISLGITASVCGLIWLWSLLLDCEPVHQRKTVPVEEMSQ